MTGSTSRTTAVFSLYNPGPSLVANVNSIRRQVTDVIVVDDGSTNDITAVLNRLRSMGCLVLTMETNSGIAAALNAGIRRAMETKPIPPIFILTMDQDSTMGDGYVASLVAAYENAELQGVKVGMVAPGVVEGLPVRSKGTRGTVVLGDEPIQSGLLVPVDVFAKLGLLMTELFIDGVDSEFYLRAKVSGYRAVLAPEARLEHSLGAMTNANIFGRQLNFRGSPLAVRTAATMRYYYIYRNRLLLASRYWRSAPLWVIRGMALDLRHLVLVTVLTSGRSARLREVAAGVADGLRGKTGPKSSNS